MAVTPKIALVTGAGTGIGKATSLALVQAGYDVVLAGRREELLQATAEEIGEPSRVLVIPTDLAEADAVEQLFIQIGQWHERLDLLFNNAGMGAPAKPLEELTVKQWTDVVAVNLTGSFLCTQEAFRLMKTQDPMGGRIINNGSVSAHAPRPNSAPYTSTKHAITGLTKSTSLDGRKYDIACGQIDIGNAATDMTARMKDGVQQADGRTMAAPPKDVDNVSRAILYMANLPPDANAQFLTIMATKMPYLGRG